MLTDRMFLRLVVFPDHSKSRNALKRRLRVRGRYRSCKPKNSPAAFARSCRSDVLTFVPLLLPSNRLSFLRSSLPKSLNMDDRVRSFHIPKRFQVTPPSKYRLNSPVVVWLCEW